MMPLAEDGFGYCQVCNNLKFVDVLQYVVYKKQLVSWHIIKIVIIQRTHKRYLNTHFNSLCV